MAMISDMFTSLIFLSFFILFILSCLYKWCCSEMLAVIRSFI